MAFLNILLQAFQQKQSIILTINKLFNTIRKKESPYYE